MIKFDLLKNEIIPRLLVFIILDLLFFWYGYQEYQFASNCKNTSAVVLRVENEGYKNSVIVEYNDHITGLPTEGVILKVIGPELKYLRQSERDRIEIMYISGMYRVYSPELAHPNYRMVFVYALCEVFLLGLTLKMFQSYRNEKANRKKTESQ